MKIIRNKKLMYVLLVILVQLFNSKFNTKNELILTMGAFLLLSILTFPIGPLLIVVSTLSLNFLNMQEQKSFFHPTFSDLLSYYTIAFIGYIQWFLIYPKLKLKLGKNDSNSSRIE